MDIQGWGVIPDNTQFGTLQRQRTPCFGPPAIVANAHAYLCSHRFRHRKTKVSYLKVLLLKVLEWRADFMIGMSRQMNFPVLPNNSRGLVDKDRSVETATVRGKFRIAQIEPD